jgi:hypothetical protein
MIIMNYVHAKCDRKAQISFYENEGLWAIEVLIGQTNIIQGIYPSLSCAQLILSTLGFEQVDQKRE